MKKEGISQEGLKLLAAVTMLLDHIGATLILTGYYTVARRGDPAAGDWLKLYYMLRIIGRVAFPIYCFMLVEGCHHTRNAKKYMLRLGIGMLLAEIPFDLALNGKLVDWSSNSVMVTLLLGCMMLLAMKRTDALFWKLGLTVPFYLLAELLKTDYAGHGILIIAMLALTRGLPQEKLLRTVAMIPLLWFGGTMSIGSVRVPIEIFGLIALAPMFLYDRRKLTRNKWVQWGFYLFYPVHLLTLWGLHTMIFS